MTDEKRSYDKQRVLDFYRGKRVLVTGHTGFKGSWLVEILSLAGAEVTGYALEPPTDPSLFNLAGLESRCRSVVGDVRDFEHLQQIFDEAQPEIVLHLAAQPIVRESYRDPRGTYETNVMGTVNLCECVRTHPGVRSFLNVTTDKVYLNREWCWGYREDEQLDGYDPYSNSKSCSELVTHSYMRSFLQGAGVATSTARAGNVIGGGDFASDRIVPDCVRAVESGSPLVIRNPHSTRPYQHVLEPLFAYLAIAAAQYEDPSVAGWYNVGPDECDCASTGDIVDLFARAWGEDERPFRHEVRVDPNAPHEASYLKLDCSKLKCALGWRPTWHIDEAVSRTVDWTRVWLASGDIAACMEQQIQDFIGA